jgi:hypothetical protein
VIRAATREGTRLATVEGGPEVRLLDASGSGLDEAGLRAWAREQCAARIAEGAGSARRVHESRSYCFPYAVVAWHETPVGVDIEHVGRCDEAFAASISAPEERADYASVADPDSYVTSLWSGKEALAKALGDALSYDPRRLVSPLRWPDGRAGAWRALSLPVPAGHVAWVCWRAS